MRRVLKVEVALVSYMAQRRSVKYMFRWLQSQP